MAAPCVSVFVNGNDAKTRARDLKVLCCYRHRFSYRFHIQLDTVVSKGGQYDCPRGS